MSQGEPLRTHPSTDEATGRTLAFEIDNIYMSLAAVARVLTAVPCVAGVRKRRPFSKWEEIHIWFSFAGHDCVVWEPFGDNSRYWIGPKNPTDSSTSVRSRMRSNATSHQCRAESSEPCFLCEQGRIGDVANAHAETIRSSPFPENA